MNVAKKQHTHFEDNILRKFAGEDKPQVVPACHIVVPRQVLRVHRTMFVPISITPPFLLCVMNFVTEKPLGFPHI